MITAQLFGSRDTAERVVVDLLLSFRGDTSAPLEPLAPAQLVLLGEVLGFSAASIRMALSRLLARQLLQQDSAGSYGFGPAGQPLRQRLASWPECLQAVTEWTPGHWLAVLQESRNTDREHQRALALSGFAELRPGLYLRPANLQGGAAAVRSDMLACGLLPHTLVVSLGDLPAAEESRARSLWSRTELEHDYRQRISELSELLPGDSELLPAERLRQLFAVGRAATRQILFDPRLPAELVDSALRLELLEITQQFYRQAVAQWRAYLQAASELS